MKFTFIPVLKCRRCAFYLLEQFFSLVLKLHLVRAHMIDHREVLHFMKMFIADIKVKRSDNPLISTKKKSRKLTFSKAKKNCFSKFFTQKLTPREPSSLCSFGQFLSYIA